MIRSDTVRVGLGTTFDILHLCLAELVVLVATYVEMCERVKK